jgi:hypothetical protein
VIKVLEGMEGSTTKKADHNGFVGPKYVGLRGKN